MHDGDAFSMINLFWRIFLSFWLSLILLSTLGTQLLSTLHQNMSPTQLIPPQQEFVDRVMMRLNSFPLDELERKITHHLHPPLKKIWHIKAADQNDSLSKQPNAIQHLLNQDPQKVGMMRDAQGLWFGPFPLSQSSGLIILQTERSPQLDPRFLPQYPFFKLLFLTLSSILAALLVSYFLARPIKQIQQKVALISQDLTTRMDKTLTQRTDEIGSLAIQINQMAEHLQRLVHNQQQILWDVSHELRSPLSRMQTALAIAEQNHVIDPTHERLQKEVTQLDTMIQQLLLLGRLNAGLQKLNQEPLHLQDLVQQLIEDMEYEYQKPLLFQMDIEHDLELPADPLLLAVALSNLLKNAWQHTPIETSVWISAKTSASQVEIQVTDQGTGVSSALLNELFIPFKRSTQSSTGLGLGLAISKNIIELHQGSIHAENVKTGGFEVTIHLPYNAQQTV